MDLFVDEYRCFMYVNDASNMLIQLCEKAIRKELDLKMPWNIGGLFSYLNLITIRLFNLKESIVLTDTSLD